jgi:hypothetical protein
MLAAAIDPSTGEVLPATVEVSGARFVTTGPKREVEVDWTRVLVEPGARAAVRTTDGRSGLCSVTLQPGEQCERKVPVSPGGSLRLRHTGAVGKLYCDVEHAGARVTIRGVERGGADLVLPLPAAAYDLRLWVVDKDATGAETETLREEIRRVEVTAGGEVVVE